MNVEKSIRWTDVFLDQLRNQGDDVADKYLKILIKDREIEHISEIFKKLDTNSAQPVHKMFPELAEYYRETRTLPASVDFERIDRGEQVFGRVAFPAALVMLTKSLPEGYAAPNLALVLNISKNLERHAYRRLLQVLQMLLNVCAVHGFEDGGRAVISAQKLRLLHAGIRHIAHKYLPDYSKKYHMVVNHEDMLATILGFSLLVLKGLRTLNCRLTEQEEEDFFYIWRVYAVMMGIYPADKKDAFDYIPDTVADAEAFYQAYARRHYRSAAENPDGVELTRANMTMLKKMIPFWLRLLGFGFAPQIYCYHLLGEEAAARVGIRKTATHNLLKSWLFRLPAFLYMFSAGHKHKTSHHYFAEIVFQKMINKKFGHIVTITVPDSLKQVKEMVLE